MVLKLYILRNMDKKLDVSWKDFLALIMGYVVSALCVGAVFVGIGYMRTKGIVGEGVFAEYELPIALATFLGFAVGGVALATIRPNVAIRNASILFLAMIAYGIWRSMSEGIGFIGILWSSLQIGGGMIFGAWVFYKLYIRHLFKKYVGQDL